MNVGEALAVVLDGATLTPSEAEEVFASSLAEEADPILLAGLLAALAQRGETVEEIAGAARALRGAMVELPHDRTDAIDTAGTGGDGLGTFNLSTAAAIVAAAAGASVIKHGNRSVSSACGSADLLEEAGVVLDLAPEAAAEVLDVEGITFLFAPHYHPAMRFAAPVRRSLGVPTIFNLLGPLCNPGRVRRQLVGVSSPQRVPQIAAVLADLGHDKALVVHCGGTDELTLDGEAEVAAVGDISVSAIKPLDYGLAPAPIEALTGGDAAHNHALLAGVLEGRRGALYDAVLLNSAAAMAVAGVVDSIRAGIEVGRDVLDSGAAADKLRTWVAATRQFADVGSS